MAKVIKMKEYALIDFDKKDFRQFKVEILAVGHNQFHVISTNGPITTKGRETLVRTNNINDAYKIFDKQIWLKKQEGFKNVEKAKKAYEMGMKIVEQEQKKKYYSSNNKSIPSVDSTKEGSCDLCSQKIPADSFDEINKWARGGGGWDTDKSFVGYKKVLCIDCQIDHGVYRKSFKKPKKTAKPSSTTEKKDA